ncbi:Tetratricopeptide repeat protein [Ooceraea biroi]|uniref:Tetratricopeptide repeat protein n=2 Tax=Ooceraea biroi TaxID=2015173 RepID=A0A026WQ21_OOCBI|nr:Tetratricopeptide repeat protein [Ooceraea biroi]
MLALKKEEAPEVFREAILYREWGHRLASLGSYPLAIDYFKKASKLAEVEDLRSLIGHCRALLRNAKYFKAEKLSGKCMTLDPDHYKARQMRMKALFQIGEFGHSLAHAYAGMRRHRMTFEHGVHQATETIEDCVGRNTSPIALLLLYPWIRRLNEHRELLIGKLKEEEQEEDEFEDIVEDESRFQVNDPEVQRQVRLKGLQRVIAKLYMGLLAIDKDFLEEIVSHPEIVASANRSSTLELLALASTCHRNVMCLQDLLRMRRPIYVTLFQRRAIPKGHKMMIEQERRLRRNIIIIQADFLLRYLHAARINKNYRTFFGFIERIKDKFDSYSDRMFPLKQKCLDALYKMVAWVYIDTRNLMCLENEEMKTRYLKHHLGIRVAMLPRDIDLAWMPTVNPKETLKMFRRRLALASAPLELVWLYHEFCKFLIDINRFDLARFYAKKGRDLAQKTDYDQWILNIDHLTLRIEIHQNNRNEAKDAAILALACARKLDIDYLIDFYERAVQAVEAELDVERIGDFDGIAARQQLILDLMPPGMKGEVDFLWRRMDVVPARRRLSVMPGCKPIDRKFKMPSTRRTILPSPRKDPERDARIALLKQHVPPLRRPGFVNFEEFE